MLKLIYASRAAVPATGEEMLHLLDQSRLRNSKLDITGLLLHAHGSFLQQLEGPAEAVEEVFASIEADPRHSELRLVTRETTKVRRFSDWTMGFERVQDAELERLIPGYRPASRYPLVNPDLVTDAMVAEALLIVFARNPMP